MSTRGHVVAVTCLALEARIALGPGVAVICNHASQLVASLEAAAKRGAAGIISFGIAGGLAPDLVCRLLLEKKKTAATYLLSCGYQQLRHILSCRRVLACATYTVS